MAKVSKHLSLDDGAAKLLESYAEQLHLSESALVSFMLTQIHLVIATLDKAERGTDGESGSD